MTRWPWHLTENGLYHLVKKNCLAPLRWVEELSAGNLYLKVTSVKLQKSVSLMIIWEVNHKKRVAWRRERHNWTVDSHWRKHIYSDESQIIVYLWPRIKRALQPIAGNINTQNELIAEIWYVWESLPVNYIQVLYQTIPTWIHERAWVAQ